MGKALDLLAIAEHRAVEGGIGGDELEGIVPPVRVSGLGRGAQGHADRDHADEGHTQTTGSARSMPNCHGKTPCCEVLVSSCIPTGLAILLAEKSLVISHWSLAICNSPPRRQAKKRLMTDDD